RNIRNTKDVSTPLAPIFEEVKTAHPNDWLLSIELVELINKRNETQLFTAILSHLENLKKQRPEVAQLISNGLELIFEKEETTH
ncbi:MAG: aromatic amino acid hydroxylase, partial [Flavobacterium sp.]